MRFISNFSVECSKERRHETISGLITLMILTQILSASRKATKANTIFLKYAICDITKTTDTLRQVVTALQAQRNISSSRKLEPSVLQEAVNTRLNILTVSPDC